MADEDKIQYENELEFIIEPPKNYDLAIQTHNLDPNSHPYLINMILNHAADYSCVDSVAKRDAIPYYKRKAGILVYCLDVDTIYQLESGLTNEDWKIFETASKQYINLARYNSPENAEDGWVYFNLAEKRLKYYIDGNWISIASTADIEAMVSQHNLDLNAHADLFAQVENKWLGI